MLRVVVYKTWKVNSEKENTYGLKHFIVITVKRLKYVKCFLFISKCPILSILFFITVHILCFNFIILIMLVENEFICRLKLMYTLFDEHLSTCGTNLIFIQFNVLIILFSNIEYLFSFISNTIMAD